MYVLTSCEVAPDCRRTCHSLSSSFTERGQENRKCLKQSQDVGGMHNTKSHSRMMWQRNNRIYVTLSFELLSLALAEILCGCSCTEWNDCVWHVEGSKLWPKRGSNSPNNASKCELDCRRLFPIMTEARELIYDQRNLRYPLLWNIKGWKVEVGNQKHFEKRVKKKKTILEKTRVLLCFKYHQHLN